ncbi:hypothetical protein VITFI_CDS3434 (plasmid) [Vitreoscilla filiformis]|uniref:Uncharacterized protein n=1 Tax=Vitreoscilla filiformis TaxID=63 RepID=A0A221KJL2_VITFI|nr:hypothetical protein VITFI_CDS3434 [Vitreoscilla filiformis]
MLFLNTEITLTADEALVLFEFLQRFSETGKLEIEDQAEERALWNLCCLLESQVFDVLPADYLTALQQARDRLRDPS